MGYKELEKLFNENKFDEFDFDDKTYKFFMLRSISKKKNLHQFCINKNIKTTNIKAQFLDFLLNSPDITIHELETYLRTNYQNERIIKTLDYNDLIVQLNKLNYFDWGGSFQNSLEKNIVNNYVKKIKDYDQLINNIEGPLKVSLQGYTLNSWYNHWTSILIENLFKDNPLILPTIGQIEKIDFFINKIPVDLKVTYFPEELMKSNLRKKNYGIELTKVKELCRILNIPIPTDMNDKILNIHLQGILKESVDPRAKAFIGNLNQTKNEIIQHYKENQKDLMTWLYENQGERRFDSAHRLFLILIDNQNIYDSWKLKRNLSFLQPIINQGIELISNESMTDISFQWDGNTFNTKASVIFAIKN